MPKGFFVLILFMLVSKSRKIYNEPFLGLARDFKIDCGQIVWVVACSYLTPNELCG